MGNNDFALDIIARLNKRLSEAQLKSDLNGLDNTLSVKVIAKSTIIEKRQKKRRGCPPKNELKKCYQNRKMIAESAIKIKIFYHILSSLYVSAGF